MAIEARLPAKERLHILDAGCGGRKQVTLDRALHRTGIDTSEASLGRYRGLDKRIVGDIQFFELKKNHYDLIICWNVLEHVSDPERALNNLFAATMPRGLIVIALPNPLSVKGLLTKLTPHFVHILVLRYVFGHKKAGQPGYAPYPTYLRFSLIPSRLRRFCAERGMEVIYMQVYEGEQAEYLKCKYPSLYMLYRLLGRVVQMLSFGYVTPTYTDVHVLIMKPSLDTTSVSPCPCDT